MTPEDKSFLRLDFIRAMLLSPYAPALDGNYLYRMTTHHSLRDAREKLEGFEKRILDKQALTVEELSWLDWFSFLVTNFIRTGELAGRWLLINGAWSFELADSIVVSKQQE